MPTWGVHLAIANKILDKKLNINKNEFLFGNILPDLQDGFLVEDVSNIVNHHENHFNYSNGKATYENFYDKYFDKLNNSLIFGYFTHLISDYYFNKKFENKYIFDDKKNFIGYKEKNDNIVIKLEEQATKDKQLDFKIFENYIYSKYKIDIPYFNENLAKYSNQIEIINIINEDVIKAISYIKKCKDNAKFQEKECFIFKNEELENEIFNVVEIINKFIKDYNLKFNK